MHPPQQQRLPFGLAEAEELNLLALALKLHAADDCRLSVFCQWVYNATKSGPPGQLLVKSYEELAAAPWGLCCRTKDGARKVVGKAVALGLVRVTEQRYVSGGQRANGYAIDWEGVRAALRCVGRRHHTTRGADGPGGHPRGLQGHPRGLQGHPRGLQGHPFKERLSLDSLFDSRTGPEAGPDRADSENDPRASTRGVCGGVAVSTLGTAVSVPDFFEEARSRTIEPLPCTERFRCGIFERDALSQRHLEQVGPLITWFRMQLGAYQPATGNTEADLLFVLAAARYAYLLRDRDVRKTRVGAFVTMVCHGDRYIAQARPHLPDARAALDRQIERYGRDALFLGTAWPPRPLASAGEDGEPP